MAFNNLPQSYNLTGLLPQHWLDWDDYSYRLGRYEVLNGYYLNLAYHAITTYSEQLKSVNRLYKHVRGVYNPAARAVETYVSKVYGGQLDTQDGNSGAIPIVTDNEALMQAIIRLWRASQWGQKKSLYVRNGASFGDTVLNIVDDIETSNVYIEPVDPRKVKSITTDSTGKLTEIVYEYLIIRDGNQVTYRQEINEERYATYIDDELTPMHTSGRGEQVAEWSNEYGFVPAVHVAHRDVGMVFGGNCWSQVMHKVDELNDLASIQNDAARRQAEMPLFGFGLQTNNIDIGSDRSNEQYNTRDNPQKDTASIVNFQSKDGRLEAIAPVLDLASSMGLINEILAEIERDLPELSLHRLRDGGNLTAPGVRASYDDAIARIQEARGNYDAGLIEAQKMAIAIGGMRGYEGYEGFNLMSYERGDLEHYIDNRPVINDTLSLNEQITLTLQAMSQNAPASVYGKMGWGKDDIKEILEAQEASTSAFMQNFEAPQDPTADEAPETAVMNEGIANVNESDLDAVGQQLALAS